MINPYDLDIIKSQVLYQIDPNSYDIYRIDSDSCEFQSSLYENLGVLRSLLNKLKNFSPSFMNELYEQTADDRIYFILNYDQNEKYILSFSLTTKDTNIIKNTLSDLKSLRVQILNWCRKQNKLQPSSDFFENVQGFPRYDVPNIECELIQGKTIISAKLKNVQINGIGIECDSQVEIQENSIISFNIGKTLYRINAILIWDSTTSDQNTKNAGYQLNFDNIKDFKRWKTFIMAMHMRTKKAAI